MSVTLLRGFGLMAPLFMSANAAYADLSAEDVWTEWRSYLESSGYEVSATETNLGGIIKIEDLSLTMETPRANTTLGLSPLEFVENGNGTVNVSLENEMTVEFKVDVEGGDEVLSGTVIMAHDGAATVVSGDPSKMTFTADWPSVNVILANLSVEGEDIDLNEALMFSATFTDLKSVYEVVTGEPRLQEQSFTAAALDYLIEFKDPTEEGEFKFAGNLQELTANGKSTIPEVDNPQDMAAFLKAGLDGDFGFTFASGSGTAEVRERNNTISSQTSSQGGGVDIALSSDGLVYAIHQKELSGTASGSDLPFPVEIKMGETAMNLALPLTGSDEEQDFALGFAFRDIEVPQIAWTMFDPESKLPRDPINVVLNLSGKGKIFFDLADGEQLAALEHSDEVPGELNALNIDEFLVSAAGAEITGDGAFTFDNTDLESFDGFPAPLGALDLNVVGANGLLDTLIEMGLVSSEDAMGARMMMGMFTVPGGGEDTLTSKIEVNDEGHVLANGQRLR